MKEWLSIAGLFLSLTSACAQDPSLVVLEDATPVRLRYIDAVSSADARAGDRVNFQVVDDVKVNSLVIIRQGTTAIGTVTEAQSKRIFGRGGRLSIRFDSTETIAGDKVALRGAKESKGDSSTVGAVLALGHGKDITIARGQELTVYTSGRFSFETSKLLSAPNGGPSETARVRSTGDALMVSVTSSPAGADIDIDGAYVGSTPSSVTLIPGDHRITVTKSGYEKWERTIRLTGGSITVNADLNRIRADR